EVNDSICKLTGYTREELLATQVEKLIHPADRGPRHERVEQLLSGDRDRYTSEQRFLNAKGEQVWVQASSTLVKTQGGEPVYRILQVQDISDRKAAEAQLHHMADHDPLTGLYNRRRLLEELDAEIARSRRYTGQVAVLVLDL